jgi:hypothetical protein
MQIQTSGRPWYKLLALALFVAFPFIAFYVGSQFEKLVYPVPYNPLQNSTTPPSATPTPSPSTGQIKSTSPTPVTKKGATQTSPSTPTQGLPYTKAVTLYASKRIQFNDLCQPEPSASNFRNGDPVMFDNRSSKSLTFSLDGQRYNLGGYSFRIITLRAAKLPYTMRIDCGSGVNNGQILLQ